MDDQRKGKAAVPSAAVLAMEPVEQGRHLLKLLVQEMIRRLESNPDLVSAAEFAQMRNLISDNSITLAQVRAGDFGELAKAVADEQFPFDAVN